MNNTSTRPWGAVRCWSAVGWRGCVQTGEVVVVKKSTPSRDSGDSSLGPTTLSGPSFLWKWALPHCLGP